MFFTRSDCRLLKLGMSSAISKNTDSPAGYSRKFEYEENLQINKEAVPENTKKDT